MRLLTAGLVLPSAALAARVLLSAGDEGIGARRHAFNSASADGAGPPAEDPAELPPEWQQRLEVSDRLAHGGYGTVYKVKITCGESHGADLALKVARPSASAEREASCSGCCPSGDAWRQRLLLQHCGKARLHRLSRLSLHPHALH
ncbi:CPK22, partial [Symbiodinium sp. CCMP2456]